jgi:hypothetical protein
MTVKHRPTNYCRIGGILPPESRGGKMPPIR